MHSNSIWNDLELQRKNENNVSKGYILTVFETIWNCREKMKTMSLRDALWPYLQRFGAAEKKWKQGHSRIHYDTILNSIWNCNEKNSTCLT